MLTELELKWLEYRKNICSRCYRKKARWCTVDSKAIRRCELFMPHVNGTNRQTISKTCSDAAEFEARVVEKLARKIPEAMCISGVKDSDHVMEANIVLKLVRLEVEQEMETAR